MAASKARLLTPSVNRVGRLATIGGVVTELAKLYREAKSGQREVGEASRLASILVALRGAIEGSQFEARLDALERGIAAPPRATAPGHGHGLRVINGGE